MVDNLTNLVWKNRIPDIEKITLITLGALRKLIREIFLHLWLARNIVVHILDSDLVPVRWINELDIFHLEEIFLASEYRLEMILRNLAVGQQIILSIINEEI